MILTVYHVGVDPTPGSWPVKAHILIYNVPPGRISRARWPRESVEVSAFVAFKSDVRSFEWHLKTPMWFRSQRVRSQRGGCRIVSTSSPSPFVSFSSQPSNSWHFKLNISQTVPQGDFPNIRLFNSSSCSTGSRLVIFGNLKCTCRLQRCKSCLTQSTLTVLSIFIW